MAYSKNRWLGLALALAVALGALVPFFAVYNPSPGAAGLTHLSSVFGERLLICTGEGFKWVKLGDLQSGKEKPGPHSGDKCPLCYIANHGLKTLASAVSAPIPVYHAADAPVSVAYDNLLIFSYSASPLYARAPPVSFIS